MRQKFLFIIISTIISFQTYSQIVFEEGYFINDKNQKTECLIKNIDWKNNPTTFEYKLEQNQQVAIGDIKFIKEFAVNNKFKFIRAYVNIDRSTENINMLKLDKEPVFNQELLFLKVLVEGEASLYYYGDVSLTRFFYHTVKIPEPTTTTTTTSTITSTTTTTRTTVSNANEIKQLVYKIYLINGADYYAKNNFFRQQLYLDLKCEKISTYEIENLGYNTSDLKNLFLKYNKCINPDYVNSEIKEKKDLFNLTIRPGLNRSSLSVDSPINDSQDLNYDPQYNFRFGVEAEFVLPFNKNKWSLTIEPTYQYYKAESTIKNVPNASGGILNTSIDYKSIELPIGIRHYFFLKNGFKIFANINYVIDLDSKASLDYTRFDGSLYKSLEIDSRNNLALGGGVKYSDKYSFEIRFQTSRELLGKDATWRSDYKTVSIILGYSFF